MKVSSILAICVIMKQQDRAILHSINSQFIKAKGSLTQHKKSVHEGVKYPCNLCDYEATEQRSLTRHKQSGHEGVKCPCNLCDYEATKQSHLTAHKKSVHAIKVKGTKERAKLKVHQQYQQTVY